MPDTKELNTFNLESEANMLNSNIYVRQIISNEKSYKDDLDRFNWFLLKDGEQGVMSNNSKLALLNLIEGSSKFQNFRSWKLPDGSQATLYKRKIINESISIINKNLIPLNLDLILTMNKDEKNQIIAILFDCIDPYIPIQFKAPPDNPHGLTTEDLVNAQNDIFIHKYMKIFSINE